MSNYQIRTEDIITEQMKKDKEKQAQVARPLPPGVKVDDRSGALIQDDGRSPVSISNTGVPLNDAPKPAVASTYVAGPAEQKINEANALKASGSYVTPGSAADIARRQDIADKQAESAYLARTAPSRNVAPVSEAQALKNFDPANTYAMAGRAITNEGTQTVAARNGVPIANLNQLRANSGDAGPVAPPVVNNQAASVVQQPIVAQAPTAAPAPVKRPAPSTVTPRPGRVRTPVKSGGPNGTNIPVKTPVAPESVAKPIEVATASKGPEFITDANGVKHKVNIGVMAEGGEGGGGSVGKITRTPEESAKIAALPVPAQVKTLLGSGDPEDRKMALELTSKQGPEMQSTLQKLNPGLALTKEELTADDNTYHTKRDSLYAGMSLQERNQARADAAQENIIDEIPNGYMMSPAGLMMKAGNTVAKALMSDGKRDKYSPSVVAANREKEIAAWKEEQEQLKVQKDRASKRSALAALQAAHSGR